MTNKIIGITGHQDIPEEAVPFLQHGIDALIDKFHHEVTCVSSLAAGADQLFAQSVLKAGGKLHAIIPCDGYEETFSDSLDLMRFDKLLRAAENIEKLGYEAPSEDAFYDAGCRVVDAAQILLAIWDGEQAQGKGGTADIVEYAQKNKTEVIVLWPNGIDR